jgi:hypothetical protein
MRPAAIALPFVEGVDGDPASSSTHSVAKGRPRGHRLDASERQLVAYFRVLRPSRHEAPSHRLEPTGRAVVDASHDLKELRRSDVVARSDGRKLPETEELSKLFRT